MAKRKAIGENPLDVGTGERDQAKRPADGLGQAVAEAPGEGPEDPKESPAKDPPGNAPPGLYLTFELAGAEYAVNVLKAREILEYGELTAVPGVPNWILGMLNLRGVAIPVVDLGIKFGLGEREITARSCIVTLDVSMDSGDEVLLGLLADTVLQVVDLEIEDIQRPPSFGSVVHAEFLQGMARVDDRLVLLLDADRALTIEELRELPQAADVEEEPGGAVAEDLDPTADEREGEGATP